MDISGGWKLSASIRLYETYKLLYDQIQIILELEGTYLKWLIMECFEIIWVAVFELEGTHFKWLIMECFGIIWIALFLLKVYHHPVQ